MSAAPTAIEYAANPRWRTCVGLLILILLNLTVVWSVRVWAVASLRAFYTAVVAEGVMYAQMLLLGMFAALAARSWFLAVAVVCVLAIARNLVAYPFAPMMLSFRFLAAIFLPLVYFAAFYQLRVFLGWRISDQPLTKNTPTQFRIHDLIICTIVVSLPCSVAAIMRRIIPELAIANEGLYELCGIISVALMTAPLALTLLSTNRVKAVRIALIIALLALGLLGWVSWAGSAWNGSSAAATSPA